MPRKFSDSGAIPFANPLGLAAIQDVIGAVGSPDTEVERFWLGEYEIFLFAVRRDRLVATDRPHADAAKNGARVLTTDRGDSAGGTTPSTDLVLQAICDRLSLKRSTLMSRGRSPPVCVGRALVAYYCIASGAASIPEVATMLRLSANSLYGSVSRYRKLYPELFELSFKEFLEVPLHAAEALLSRRRAKQTPPDTLSDAEIAQRLARDLPPDLRPDE